MTKKKTEQNETETESEKKAERSLKFCLLFSL